MSPLAVACLEKCKQNTPTARPFVAPTDMIECDTAGRHCFRERHSALGVRSPRNHGMTPTTGGVEGCLAWHRCIGTDYFRHSNKSRAEPSRDGRHSVSRARAVQWKNSATKHKKGAIRGRWHRGEGGSRAGYHCSPLLGSPWSRRRIPVIVCKSYASAQPSDTHAYFNKSICPRCAFTPR